MKKVDIRDFKRIVVVGNNGSGKSWLSSRLAELTALPLTHLDAIFWQPGWQMPSPESWAETQRELVAGEKWIIEGNHTGTMEIRFAAADLIILLDVNRLTCFWGIHKRSGKQRSDMPDNLGKDSGDKRAFLKGVWDFPRKRRKTILQLHEKYPETEFLVLRGRREMHRLLKELE